MLPRNPDQEGFKEGSELKRYTIKRYYPMTDAYPKTDKSTPMGAPGVGGDSSKKDAPMGPAVTSPQPKGVDPLGEPAGNTGSKEPMRVSTQPKP